MALARLNHSSSGKVPTGQANEVYISDASFKSAHRAFEANKEPHSKKRKREGAGDPSKLFGDGAFKGPWARREHYRPDAAEEESGSEEVEEVYEEDELEERPAAPVSKMGTAYEETGNGKESTEFHGDELHDYQGRTYMHVPQDRSVHLRNDETPRNHPPKPHKVIHTYHGHTKGITRARFFPGSGHLLLSASADTKIMLWDVYHPRGLLRSFSGHNRALTDIDFTPSGTHFFSAAYDRQMKQWDTETGACLTRFSTGATPHCVRVNPSSPSEFLAGMSDKKIVQFDARSSAKDPVQVYDHHLGAVNTLTFVDDARRFLTTSDDKSLRAWEYGINVPIKYIAETDMHSLVRAAPHPSGKYVAFQAQNNEIVVYSSGDRFRKRNKAFRGHNSAGSAPDVAISPDGKWIASGDTGGFVYFWSWNTGALEHKIQTASAKAGPGGAACSVVQWHPREPSQLITGGLEGNLKLWDRAK